MSEPEETPPPKSTHVILVDDSDPQHVPQGCSILCRYPVVSVLAFALVGICIGVGLSFWEPADMDAKDVSDPLVSTRKKTRSKSLSLNHR